MSASHEKTIQINREFFKPLGGKRTSGRRQTRKVTTSPKDDASTERRKELIRSIKKARSSKPSTSAPALTALGDAMSFFAGEQEAAKKRGFRVKERTSRVVVNEPPVVGLGEMPIALRQGEAVSQQMVTTSSTKSTEPGYGCLKNGKKPTYRQWRRTRRQGIDQSKSVEETLAVPASASASAAVVVENPPKIPLVFKPRKEKLDAIRQKSRTRCAKVRQIPTKSLRRTRKIGMHGDRIIVATPSRQERDVFQNSLIEIRATPIADINKKLIGSGLATYGGSAPDDVKRRMFEDGWLAGGARAIDCDIAVNNVLSMEVT